MKKTTRLMNSGHHCNTTTLSSIWCSEYSDLCTCQLLTELHAARNEISCLKQTQTQLQAALSDSRQEQASLNNQVKALKTQLLSHSPYGSPEALTVLQAELTRRDRLLRQRQDEETLDRLVVLDALKRVLKKSEEHESVRDVLAQYLDTPVESLQLSQAVVKVLRFAEQLIESTGQEPDQLSRVSKLNAEMRASIERSRELLNTPKRDVLRIDRSQATVSQERRSSEVLRKLARANTRVTICKARAARCGLVCGFKDDV